MTRLDDVVLPCGCVLTRLIVDGKRTLQVAPCNIDCPTLQDALQVADELGKPVEFEER